MEYVIRTKKHVVKSNIVRLVKNSNNKHVVTSNILRLVKNNSKKQGKDSKKMKFKTKRHPIVSNIIKLVAGIPAYKKGDRVIVNFNTTKDPEYYAGTVSSLRKGLVNVKFDDGDKGSYKPTRSKVGLVGLIKGKKKRKTEIPAKDIDKWLLVDVGEAKPARPKKKNTVEKKHKLTYSGALNQIMSMFKRTKVNVVGMPPKTVSLFYNNEITDVIVNKSDYTIVREATNTRFKVDDLDSLKRFIIPSKGSDSEFEKFISDLKTHKLFNYSYGHFVDTLTNSLKTPDALKLFKRNPVTYVEKHMDTTWGIGLDRKIVHELIRLSKKGLKMENARIARLN